MVTIIVNVTQGHIDRGRACDTELCPVALALNEKYSHDFEATRMFARSLGEDASDGTELDFRVGSSDVLISNFVVTALLPEPAMKFIYRFDRQMEVTPLSFELQFDI